MNTIRATSFGLAMLLGGLCSAQLGVINAEYFWDNDPGAGNGTAFTAQDGAFGETVEAIVAEVTNWPSLGAHRFSVRSRDEDNTWGPVFSTVVNIELAAPGNAVIGVQEAEYFWDNDPGEGNGNPMLAFDGDFDQALEQLQMETSALPDLGQHVLGIRARDLTGNWGPVFQVLLQVEGSTATLPEIHVGAAEYWFDDDPGEGSGTAMLATDGAFDGALEAIMGGEIPLPVDAGFHVLWMRSRDDDGGWGPAFGVVVNMDTTIGPLSVNDVAEPQGMRLIPNPADPVSGTTIVLGHIAKEALVQLFDMSGREVMSQRTPGRSRIPIDSRSLPPGVYAVRVLADGAEFRDRLVVR